MKKLILIGLLDLFVIGIWLITWAIFILGEGPHTDKNYLISKIFIAGLGCTIISSFIYRSFFLPKK